jgi:hypothetical protein
MKFQENIRMNKIFDINLHNKIIKTFDSIENVIENDFNYILCDELRELISIDNRFGLTELTRSIIECL